mgnify:CR=1 FL=1
MTIKKFSLACAVTAIIALCAACGSRNDNSELRGEIMADITEFVNEFNDSAMNKVIIEEGPAGASVNSGRSEISRDSIGNLHMSVQVNVDDTQTIDSDNLVALVCGSLAILGAFAVPIFIVYFIGLFIFKSKRDKNNIIRLAIESGRELPKEFFAKEAPKFRLQSAIQYIAWSVGLFVFFIVVGADAVAYLCLIPFIIGIGKLIAYFLYEHKKSDKTNENNCTGDNAE